VRHTLYAKLAVVALSSFLALGIGYVALSLYTTERHFAEVQQKLNRDLADHLVREKILMVDGSVNEAALKDVFHMLMVINPSIELYLLDPKGEILAFSAPPGSVVRESVSLVPVDRFLASDTLPILGDDPRDASRSKVFSVAPVRTPKLQGYIYVILASEEYDSAAQMVLGSYILRLSTGLAAFALVSVLVVALVSFRLLTRRLNRLAHDMDRFRGETSGTGAAPSHPAEGDEIDLLVDSFNRMSGVINQQVERLERTDSLRRELVANVSHDLRTPLASLHGYLETLSLKDAELSEEDRRHCLGVALRNSERLRKLVSELFELAKLDAKEVRPEFESFSLPELVQDVVQDFQLEAEEKGVELRAHLSERLPFVRADIRLIERVLENLIGNALRYTPRGGAVEISLCQEEGRVKVEIHDSGCGIPADELPHIFERFHRVQPEPNDEAAGGGLGLAISKRILELHASMIQARSRLDEGTTFTFHLSGAV
jgi:two-component system OmpR family sensor kinase